MNHIRQDYPRRKSPAKQPKPPQKDRLAGLLLLQTGICALGLALLLAARLSGPASFGQAKELAVQLCGKGQEEIMLDFSFAATTANELWVQLQSLCRNFQEKLKESIHKNIQQTQPTAPLPNGKGGVGEVSGISSDSALMQPPQTASFAPYYLTAALKMPVAGQVSSGFGYRLHPITGKYDFHSGLDIAAAQGSMIYAALPGKVEEAAWSDSFGYYIKLRHSPRLETVYCHCSELLAQEGEALRRGDRIAKVGSSGISTGAHLHFEIRIEGKKVDPMQALFPFREENAESLS